MTLRLACRYDDGYFDKDEQGWVSAWTEVTTDEATGIVRVHHWGDRNGIGAYDTMVETRVDRVFEALQLVKLEHPRWYFDLAKGRLVDVNTGVFLARGVRTEPGFLEASRVQAAIDFLASLVENLGGPALPPPRFREWPARTSSDPYVFVEVKTPLPHDFKCIVRSRLALRPEYTPEFTAWLTSDFLGASLTVDERGLSHVHVRGGLEHHDVLRPRAGAWLAGWR